MIDGNGVTTIRLDRHRVRKEPHGEVQAAEYAGSQHPGGLRAADVEQPVRRSVHEVAAGKADDRGQEHRAREQRVGDRSSRRIEVERERAHDHRHHEAREDGVAGAAEIDGQQLPDQVDRAQEVHDDVAGADALGEFGQRPQEDHADQPLPRPDEGGELRLVVAGHGAGARLDDGQHHREAEESEHRVGDDGRHHRLAIGRVPLEPRRRQRHVRTIGRGLRSGCMWRQAIVSSHNRDSLYRARRECRRSADPTSTLAPLSVRREAFILPTPAVGRERMQLRERRLEPLPGPAEKRHC